MLFIVRTLFEARLFNGPCVFVQLLETMVKNCGDHVHFQIAEKNILPEMVKIVKKKACFYGLVWLYYNRLRVFFCLNRSNIMSRLNKFLLPRSDIVLILSSLANRLLYKLLLCHLHKLWESDAFLFIEFILILVWNYMLMSKLGFSTTSWFKESCS